MAEPLPQTRILTKHAIQRFRERVATELDDERAASTMMALEILDYRPNSKRRAWMLACSGCILVAELRRRGTESFWVVLTVLAPGHAEFDRAAANRAQESAAHG